MFITNKINKKAHKPLMAQSFIDETFWWTMNNNNIELEVSKTSLMDRKWGKWREVWERGNKNGASRQWKKKYSSPYFTFHIFQTLNKQKIDLEIDSIKIYIFRIIFLLNMQQNKQNWNMLNNYIIKTNILHFCFTAI